MSTARILSETPVRLHEVIAERDDLRERIAALEESNARLRDAVVERGERIEKLQNALRRMAKGGAR